MEEVSNYGVVDVSNQVARDCGEAPDIMKLAPSEYVLCGGIFPDNTKNSRNVSSFEIRGVAIH